jgi:hypothetical protein
VVADGAVPSSAQDEPRHYLLIKPAGTSFHALLQPI